MGDVKFAGLIGIALSWISFPSGLIGLGIAFIASSIFSILVFVVKRDRFQRIIPFAPFMLLGLLFVEFGLLL
jgi:leader peptidase (prepilin peptidase)/N-methyltransferase